MKHSQLCDGNKHCRYHVFPLVICVQLEQILTIPVLNSYYLTLCCRTIGDMSNCVISIFAVWALHAWDYIRIMSTSLPIFISHNLLSITLKTTGSNYTEKGSRLSSSVGLGRWQKTKWLFTLCSRFISTLFDFR